MPFANKCHQLAQFWVWIQTSHFGINRFGLPIERHSVHYAAPNLLMPSKKHPPVPYPNSFSLHELLCNFKY